LAAIGLSGESAEVMRNVSGRSGSTSSGVVAAHCPCKPLRFFFLGEVGGAILNLDEARSSRRCKDGIISLMIGMLKPLSRDELRPLQMRFAAT
jgi:hypothetical protein